MGKIKTTREIEIMSRAGKILGEVLFETLKHVKPGVTELELDQIAEALIIKKGGFPGFKKVDGYKHSICVSTNNVVVHGIPKERKLKDGDIIGIDAGVFIDGYHSDMAETVIVGKTEGKEKEKFLKVGKEAMYAGIKEAEKGNRIGDISSAIQIIVEGNGYSVVRSLVGHGVGRELHEEPQVPGYLSGKISKTPELASGMTIAIEVIYNMGKKEVVYDGSDDWTISTKDHSLSGVFERTIVITDKEPHLLTAFPNETL